MSKFVLLNIGKVVGSIYTLNAVHVIDLDDVSPFAWGLIIGSLTLVILILNLLIKYLPDKQSDKVVASMPFVIIGTIIVIVIIGVIFDK